MDLGRRALQALQGAALITSSDYPRSPFLDIAGAVEADETGVAAHYGQPFAEQRALAAGEAIVDLSHHDTVSVAGADRLSWLNSMTSQELLGLQPGESTETLLLDPNGRIQHAMGVVDDGERTWLLVEGGAGEALSEFLLRMRFALRVEVEHVTAEVARVLAFDGSALTALNDQFKPHALWRDQWADVARGGYQYARGQEPGGAHAAAGWWKPVQLILPRTELEAAADFALAHPLKLAGVTALDALQIQAWRPSFAGDVDERAIPNELDWLRSAVHLEKGCYRGQETVAKVHNIGRPPRRLVMLHLDGWEGELPEPGALLTPEDAGEDARPVGRITRAARHYELGDIALALLKRNTPEDAVLRVQLESGEALRASQEIIVPSDAGATRGVPRLRRLG